MVAFSLGLAALFRKQWVVRERLTYPLGAASPSDRGGHPGRPSLLQQRLFWAGCLTVIACHSLSTAHAFAPSIPGMPDRIDIRSWQQTIPWNALDLPFLELFFAVVGVIYLLPTDVFAARSGRRLSPCTSSASSVLSGATIRSSWARWIRRARWARGRFWSGRCGSAGYHGGTGTSCGAR